MEIVTHPMTLEYHIKETPWRDILREAVSMGYVSHQSGTCGLHVHVNRSSLGDIEVEQEDAIARILFLIENMGEIQWGKKQICFCPLRIIML